MSARHRRPGQGARSAPRKRPDPSRRVDGEDREDCDDRDDRHGESDVDGGRQPPAASLVDPGAARGVRREVKVRLKSAPPIADALAPIERGTRVRVIKGPFSGKVGLVSDLDGKGGARVMLGLLAVRLRVENLTAMVEGGRRPVLSTSHRKPAPARS